MRKKILVRAPVLSRSGYGEHSRFVMRSLRTREDLFEIYVVAVNWGQTGWMSENTEERSWIDQRIRETALYLQKGGNFDLGIQVTIPNEWEQIAPINVGVTAGIETNRAAPVWLERSNMMNKVITISEHSKNVLEKTSYEGTNRQTGQQMMLKCETPIKIVHYPVKTFDNLPDLNIDLEYDFNYLSVAQSGPRKNMESVIRGFVEENIDQEVGLVLKTFLSNGSRPDRERTENMLQQILVNYPDRKCKVYLIHGDMSDAEMHAFYVHPKIKCLVSLTHGEGFGLPLFEASYSGLPIIAPGWSGHCDFLYAPRQESNKKKKNSKKEGKIPYFAEVEYDMAPVPAHAVWEGVIQADSMWCNPQNGSYKMKLRDVRKNYDKWKKKAVKLQKWVRENFDGDKQKELFCEEIYSLIRPQELSPEEQEWVSSITNQVVSYD